MAGSYISDGRLNSIVVATTAARDAIPSSKLFEGLVVYVEGTGNRYLYKDSSWQHEVIDFEPDASFFDSAATVTIYVDPVSGSDGYDGYTEAAAFKTIQAALNSIPQGFMADTIIQVAAGQVAETVIDFSRLRHGGAPYPSLIVRGEVNVAHEFISNGAASSSIVSAGGVTKLAQHTVSTDSWGTPIVSGDHFFRIFVAGESRYYAAPCLGGASDNTTGILGYCGSSNFMFSGDVVEIYTCATSFTEPVVRIDGDEQRAITFEFFDFSECSFMYSKQAGFLGCKMTSSGAEGGSTSTLEGCYFPSSNSYARIYDGDLVSLRYCYFEVGVFFIGGNILEIRSCVFTHNQWKLVLGADYIGGNKTAIVGNLSMRGLVNCDFEGGGVGIAADHCTPRLTGDISFEGGSNPIRLRYGSVFLRDSGIVSGKGTGPILVESSSQMVIGSAVAHTYENTLASSEQIKVGGNPATTLSSLPQTDLGLGDNSELCRAS